MTRTLSLAVAVTAATLFTGCARNEITTQAQLAPEPPNQLVFADTADPVRDFSQSTSYIQNGDTVARSSGFLFRSYDDINVGAAPLVEPGIFVLNVLTLPYALITQRGEQTSSGLQFAPTHAAMPALPESTGGSEMGGQPTAQPGEDSSPEMNSSDMATPATMEATEAAPSVLTRLGTDSNAPAFTVAGQVQRPGTYDVTDLKLSQVVTAAGPSTQDPTKVSVQIARPGEETASTTLDQLLGGAVDDVVIKQGDVITISVLP